MEKLDQNIEGRQELTDVAEWENIKNRRNLFEVNDYRGNHPDSAFKSEIDMLYYELRDEELNNMRTCPAEYNKYDVERLIDAGIFSLSELIDYELLPDRIVVTDRMPDIAMSQVEDSNLNAPENCTDIYFFGRPGSGKTGLLMGLLGINGGTYTLNTKTQGGKYASALQEYVRAGITPGGTLGRFVTVINGKVNETDKKGNIISHPINLIEMSGEEFALRITDAKGVTLVDMGTGITNLLKNNNHKVFFIVVDPTRLTVKVGTRVETKDATGNVTGYEIKNKCVSQLDILNKFVSLFELPENQEIMKKVTAIHFVVTKADMLGETIQEQQVRAKELLLDIYEGPVQHLKDYCRWTKCINHSTNYSPCVYTFSLGKFYLGDVFDYNATYSVNLINAISSMLPTPYKYRSWWEKLKYFLNK